MILALVLMLSRVKTARRVAEARKHTEENRQGLVEGHAAMDMSVTGGGGVLRRALSPKGFIAITHFYVMDWASVWTDIGIGC